MNIITCKLVFRYFMKILNSNFVMTKYLTGKIIGVSYIIKHMKQT